VSLPHPRLRRRSHAGSTSRRGGRSVGGHGSGSGQGCADHRCSTGNGRRSCRSAGS
jgi:hypothetical protein